MGAGEEGGGRMGKRRGQKEGGGACVRMRWA